MANMRNLTDEQATDLALYLLGYGWVARSVGGHYRLTNLRGEGSFAGAGWREVFRAAGAEWPARSRYTQHGHSVMIDGRAIATCVSSTKAALICGLLNAYCPPA